jgi:hypothetical protein
MAGYFMALLPMLQLKNALGATIASVHYNDIKWTKKTRPTKMEAFITTKEAWYAIYLFLPCVYLALQVLQLAEKASSGMDEL